MEKVRKGRDHVTGVPAPLRMLLNDAFFLMRHQVRIAALCDKGSCAVHVQGQNQLGNGGGGVRDSAWSQSDFVMARI